SGVCDSCTLAFGKYYACCGLSRCLRSIRLFGRLSQVEIGRNYSCRECFEPAGRGEALAPRSTNRRSAEMQPYRVATTAAAYLRICCDCAFVGWSTAYGIGECCARRKRSSLLLLRTLPAGERASENREK